MAWRQIVITSVRDSNAAVAYNGIRMPLRVQPLKLGLLFCRRRRFADEPQNSM
jgi:hypothetical protein